MIRPQKVNAKGGSGFTFLDFELGPTGHGCCDVSHPERTFR